MSLIDRVGHFAAYYTNYQRFSNTLRNLVLYNRLHVFLSLHCSEVAMYIRNDGRRFVGGINFKPEEWFLLTLAYSNTKGQTLLLYKDETRMTINQSSTFVTVQGPYPDKVMFGSYFANRNLLGSGAKFDDMAMWNRPLTSDEVTAVMRRTTDK